MSSIPNIDAYKLDAPPDDGEAYERWTDQHSSEEMADGTADALTCWIDASTPERREAVAALRGLLQAALRPNLRHLPGHHGALTEHLAELAAAVDVTPSFEAWCQPEEDVP